MITRWFTLRSGGSKRLLSLLAIGWLSLVVAGEFRAFGADLIEMQNGDRYAGKILSMDTNEVVVQSDVLGKITLPRAKVAKLTLASTTASPLKTPAITTNAVSSAVVITNGSADLAAAFRGLGTNQNALQAIRQQYLLDAGPEANAKFDALLGGVMSGKVSINDLRAQAASAADQLRQFKRELGDGAGSELDGYLAILDHFLKETQTVTNSVAPAKSTAPTPAASHN